LTYLKSVSNRFCNWGRRRSPQGTPKRVRAPFGLYVKPLRMLPTEFIVGFLGKKTLVGERPWAPKGITISGWKEITTPKGV